MGFRSPSSFWRGTPLVVALLLQLPCACTTWHQIDGPVLGLGVDADPERGLSPRIEGGYGFERRKPLFGYGFAGQVGYSPLAERLDVFVEAHGNLFPIIPFGIGVGPVYSVGPDQRYWGMVLSLDMVLVQPPGVDIVRGWSDPCTEVDPDALFEDDVVYPTWLPSTNLRGFYSPQRELGECDDASESCTEFNLVGTVEVTLSRYWIGHGEPQPLSRGETSTEWQQGFDRPPDEPPIGCPGP